MECEKYDGIVEKLERYCQECRESNMDYVMRNHDVELKLDELEQLMVECRNSIEDDSLSEEDELEDFEFDGDTLVFKKR